MAVSRRKDGIGPGRHGNDGIGCDIGIVEPGIAIGPAVVDRYGELHERPAVVDDGPGLA